jgi:hypothetical protein
MKLHIRESDIETLCRTSGNSKATVLQHIMDTIHSIEMQYKSRIRKQDIISVQDRGELPFARVRVYKPSKIRLRYSMFYNKHSENELWCMVKTIRSRYPAKPYTDQQIKDMYFAEQMEKVLS